MLSALGKCEEHETSKHRNLVLSSSQSRNAAVLGSRDKVTERLGNGGIVVNDPNGFVCSTCRSLSSTLMPWMAVEAELMSVSGTGGI